MSRTVHDIFHLHTCARGSRLAEDVLCERLRILQKSFCPVRFHRPLIDVPDFSTFCSTPLPPTTTSHLLVGTQPAPSATPHGGLLFWHSGRIQRSHRLGRDSQTDEHIVGSKAGVFRTRAVVRVTEDMLSLTWNGLRGERRRRREADRPGLP